MDFFLICLFWWDISPSQSDYGFQLPWFFLKWLELDVTSLCGKSGLFLLFFVGLCGLLLLCLSCLWVAVWWTQTLLVDWVWKWPRIPRQSIWDLMIFPQEETNQLSMIPFLGYHLPSFFSIKIGNENHCDFRISCALNRCLLVCSIVSALPRGIVLSLVQKTCLPTGNGGGLGWYRWSQIGS